MWRPTNWPERVVNQTVELEDVRGNKSIRRLLSRSWTTSSAAVRNKRHCRLPTKTCIEKQIGSWHQPGYNDFLKELVWQWLIKQCQGRCIKSASSDKAQEEKHCSPTFTLNFNTDDGKKSAEFCSHMKQTLVCGQDHHSDCIGLTLKHRGGRRFKARWHLSLDSAWKDESNMISIP